MKYKLIVDKQSRTNPSTDKREYEIDIEELRVKGDVYDSLVITVEETYIIRRLSLSEYQVLSVLEEPIKESLGDLNVQLFEGDNYIYLMDLTGNKFYAEYIVKNEFNELYVTNAQMNSAINQSARNVEISVNQKLTGYSTIEKTEASIKMMADSIKSEVKGIKESAIAKVDVQYALSDSEDTAPTSGWSTIAPTWQSGKYMWQKTVTTNADGTVSESDAICISGAKGDTGPQGEQGIQGETGATGKTTYFHIKYSAVANPTDSSQISETPNTYIGTYVDFIENDSTDPKKYTWTQFKGSQGEKGDKGISGTNGVDGKTSYLHIAYATSADGKTGFSVSESTNKLYIGQYTDFTETDSTDPTKYNWSLIKGDKGIGVKKIVEQYYLSTSNESQTGGSWKTTQDKWEEGKYIWTRSQVTWDDNTVTYTDPILATNTNEAFSLIEQTKESIAQKVGKGELGTLLEQNAEHIKIAWNKISEFIQFAINESSNAQLQIKDNKKKLLMALDKLGMHFYKNTGAELGDIGIMDFDGTPMISFNLDMDTNNDAGMAWGMKRRRYILSNILYKRGIFR